MAIDFSKPVETVDGRPVTILSTEGRGNWPVIGYVGDEDVLSLWTRYGTSASGKRRNLRNVPSLDLTKPLQTRGGRAVELISVKGRGVYPLVGYVGDSDAVEVWTATGRWNENKPLSALDLVNVKHADRESCVAEPTISGTPEVGSTLTLTEGTWTDPPKLQWRRNGVDIPGATGPTYTLTGADIGATLSVAPPRIDLSKPVQTRLGIPVTVHKAPRYAILPLSGKIGSARTATLWSEFGEVVPGYISSDDIINVPE